MKKSLKIIVPLITAGVLLTGCTVSAYQTVSTDKVISKAEDALEQQVGSRPDITCDGAKDSVPLRDGESLDCVLTDPASGTQYQTTVSLEYSGSGDTYRVNAKVAETPLN